DALDPEWPVDLATQEADVGVDDVRAVLVFVVPRMLEELEAGKDVSWPSHEGLQERELLRRELDLGLATPDLSPRWIEAQVPDPKLRRPLDRTPPHQGAQPGEELAVGERLGELIVRAAVEPGNAVPDGVASGQHQDRGPD